MMPASRLRKRPVQARSRLTVDVILEGADRVLKREGYAAASTNRIAHVAGFSIGSLYQYFDHKQAVLGALIDRELVRDAHAMLELAEELAGETPLEILAGVAGRMLERRASQRHLYRTLVRHADEIAEGRALDHVLRIETPLLTTVVRSAQPARARGLPEPQPCALWAWLHALALHWAAEAPAHVSRAAMLVEIRRVAGAYLSDGAAASPDTRRWLERWTPVARARSEIPARVLRDARVHLLAHTAAGAPELEARAFAVLGLVELLGYAHRRGRDEGERVALIDELARLADAALTPARAAGSLPRIA